MAQWFETRIRYDKMQSNGAVKKVTETYLVAAVTFAEAEERVVKEMKNYISGDFSVMAIKKPKISEIFNEDSERFYLVKCGFISIDEKTGTEKRVISEMLIGAIDFSDAVNQFKYIMKDTVSDYEIISVSETTILEIYK